MHNRCRLCIRPMIFPARQQCPHPPFPLVLRIEISAAARHTFERCIDMFLEESQTWRSLRHTGKNALGMGCPSYLIERLQYSGHRLKTLKISTQWYDIKNMSTDYSRHLNREYERAERDRILPQFHGIVSHDHETKFYGFGTGDATCAQARRSRKYPGAFVHGEV